MHAPFYFKAKKIENPSPKSPCNICLLSEIHIDFFLLLFVFVFCNCILDFYLLLWKEINHTVMVLLFTATTNYPFLENSTTEVSCCEISIQFLANRFECFFMTKELHLPQGSGK